MSPNLPQITEVKFKDIKPDYMFCMLLGYCTNISVGYDNQHTEHETQDLAFADKLVNALLKVDWLKQSSHRNPAHPPQIEYHLSEFQCIDYYDYLDEQLEDHIYHLQNIGARYAAYLVLNDPTSAAELLLYLAKTR